MDFLVSNLWQCGHRDPPWPNCSQRRSRHHLLHSGRKLAGSCPPSFVQRLNPRLGQALLLVLLQLSGAAGRGRLLIHVPDLLFFGRFYHLTFLWRVIVFQLHLQPGVWYHPHLAIQVSGPNSNHQHWIQLIQEGFRMQMSLLVWPFWGAVIWIHWCPDSVKLSAYQSWMLYGHQTLVMLAERTFQNLELWHCYPGCHLFHRNYLQSLLLLEHPALSLNL